MQIDAKENERQVKEYSCAHFGVSWGRCFCSGGRFRAPFLGSWGVTCYALSLDGCECLSRTTGGRAVCRWVRVPAADVVILFILWKKALIPQVASKT